MEWVNRGMIEQNANAKYFYVDETDDTLKVGFIVKFEDSPTPTKLKLEDPSI